MAIAPYINEWCIHQEQDLLFARRPTIPSTLLSTIPNTTPFDELLDSIGPYKYSSPVEAHYANEWEEHCIHQAFTRFMNGDFTSRDTNQPDCEEIQATEEFEKQGGRISRKEYTSIQAICRSKSEISIRSVPSDMTQEFEEALLHLSKHLAILKPRFCMSDISKEGDIRNFLRRCSSFRARIETENDIFPILIDSGCSTACSGHIDDFCGQLAFGDFGTVKTADGSAQIQGFGMLHWKVIDRNGKAIILKVPGYYCPAIQMRLLSPQDYCRFHKIYPVQGKNYWGTMDGMSMFILRDDADGLATIDAPMEPMSRLPMIFGEIVQKEERTKSEPTTKCESCSQANVSINIYDPRNVNLSPAQKALKLDHDRLGHIGFKRLQALYKGKDTFIEWDGSVSQRDSCLHPTIEAQASCSIPACATCMLAKSKKKSRRGKIQKEDSKIKDILRSDDLVPGSVVSVDHYASPVRGRLPNTYGREAYKRRYCGGTLFYDHASGKIFINHQVSLDGSDTIRSKRKFEREALQCGVSIQKYHADNGIFTKQEFTEELENDNQYLSLSGVGAHHQNGVAERAIGTVQSMARSMLLHVRLMWPEQFDAALWPFAFDYAVHIYNHMPIHARQLSPQEIFCGTVLGCSALQRLRVFGCPAYVLDARIQDGKKIPKWEPRARLAQFLGFSKEHSTLVALVLNVKTGGISPQFHVVYDELFETVTSEMEIDMEEKWIELFKGSRDLYLDWFELEGGTRLVPECVFEDAEQFKGEDDNRLVEDNLLPAPPMPETAQPRQSTPQQQDSSSSKEQSTSLPKLNNIPEETGDEDEPKYFDVEWGTQPPRTKRRRGRKETKLSLPQNSSRRYNLRSRKKATILADLSVREIMSPIFSHIEYISDPDTLAMATLDWEHVSDDPYCQYFDEIFTTFYDEETMTILDADAIHPFALASKLHNEDFPSYQDIIRMPPEERNKWMDSMDEELQALYEFGTFEFIPRSEVEEGEEIIKTTWAFRKKRKPSGEVYRYKSRLCVRGDLQNGNYDLNETFAPVAEWSTVRLLFTLCCMMNWTSASIDFKNAFAQATLPKPIYLELPQGYAKANPGSSDLVMKIKKSLYGDRRAANLWYRKIRGTLEGPMGFTVSTMDPCLFIRHDCMIALYVDDAILFAKDEESIQKVLDDLKTHEYDYSRDGTFSSYLGILLERREDGTMKLSQPGLKQQIVEILGLKDSTPKATPISQPLLNHSKSEPFNQSFNYRSAIGMLLYVGNNTHPECTYAINACARHCVAPKVAHAEAVKRIGRYLKGVINEGLIIKKPPDNGEITLDCHCDADFAGNYNKLDGDDPVSVRSRTGYVVTLGNVPVLWKSKVQSEIALSTMEAEYISLSTSMRSLIQLRSLLFEMNNIFDLGLKSRLSTISTVFEDNSACRILATTDPPRLTPRSKHIAIKYHWFREHLSDEIRIVQVPTKKQKGDGFTKPLDLQKFSDFRLDICGW